MHRFDSFPHHIRLIALLFFLVQGSCSTTVMQNPLPLKPAQVRLSGAGSNLHAVEGRAAVGIIGGGELSLFGSTSLRGDALRTGFGVGFGHLLTERLGLKLNVDIMSEKNLPSNLAHHCDELCDRPPSEVTGLTYSSSALLVYNVSHTNRGRHIYLGPQVNQSTVEKLTYCSDPERVSSSYDAVYCMEDNTKQLVRRERGVSFLVGGILGYQEWALPDRLAIQSELVIRGNTNRAKLYGNRFSPGGYYFQWALGVALYFGGF